MGAEWPVLPVLWAQGHVPSPSHSMTLSSPLSKAQEPLLTRPNLSSLHGVEGAPRVREKLYSQQAHGRTSTRRASEMTKAQSL